MIIQHNMAAMFTQRQLGITGKGKATAAERLGSGYRINRAADDAAGLSISEKMRGQIRGLERASKNIQDGISYVQVADGALNEVHSIMQRMRELAVQAANDTYVESDREATDAEIQQLKEQIDSILAETEFNTRPIWDVNAEGKKLVGTVKKTAVTGASVTWKSTNLNNQNKYKISSGDYIISANEQGMQLSWTDYYGDVHKVPGADVNGNEQYVQWPEPDAPEHPQMPGERYLPQRYSVDFADYMTEADKDLGLKFPLSFSITEGSTVADLVDSLNGTRFITSEPTSLSVETDGSVNGFSSLGAYFNDYRMFLALDSADGDVGGNAIPGVDFSRKDDVFLEATSPNNVTLPDASSIANMDGNWTISFTSPSYPGVSFEAISKPQVSYFVTSTEPEHKGLWWDYYKASDGSLNKYQLRYYINQDADMDTTLEAINAALTDPSQNMLRDSVDNDGGKHGGKIELTFDLTASEPLKIKNPDGTTTAVGTVGADGKVKIGTVYMDIDIAGNDTVDTVKAKLSTLKYLDIVSTASKSVSVRFSDSVNKEIDSPLWEATNAINVQAGANEQQNVRMTYDAIRTYNIGLTSTNVLTRTDAGTAITEVDDAMEIISQQRSYFGAIQNRLEHAQLNADNTGENLQASESGIRDADMAEEMVELSKLNILEQAAQAVMAQENRATEGVLKLLQ